ncbi:MAG TPA: hypothetical protein VGB63_07935 [Pedobacter sp.]
MKKFSKQDLQTSLALSSYLFNSIEFQDSLKKLSFKYSNYCLDCGTNVPERQERITGATILDSIFRSSEAEIDFRLKRMGKPPLYFICFGLGNTCPASKKQTPKVTSNYLNIKCDMGKELPFTHAYAVHICHEYVHYIGYCHTDHKDDVAEEVGLIAYHFIKKWHEEGTRFREIVK